MICPHGACIILHMIYHRTTVAKGLSLSIYWHLKQRFLDEISNNLTVFDKSLHKKSIFGGLKMKLRIVEAGRLSVQQQFKRWFHLHDPWCLWISMLTTLSKWRCIRPLVVTFLPLRHWYLAKMRFLWRLMDRDFADHIAQLTRTCYMLNPDLRR